MAESLSNHLKVFADDRVEVIRPEIEGIAAVPAVLEAFAQATGWSLSYVPAPQPSQSVDPRWSAPVNPGVGTPPGHLRLEPAGSVSGGRSPRKADERSAKLLAGAIGDMLGELLHTRHVLWHREAELAAGVPVVQHPQEQQHLVVRLQAVLKAGAEAVGGQAAALYMLDEATTQLKLRAAWELPLERLTDPARPLSGALADLEALLGHAVVLKDPAMLTHWRAPEEDFRSAVCVPVSTPTSILGTLWIFSRESRDFSSQQANIVEVTAGRVASDLEREMLMREGVDGAHRKKELAAAARWQRNLLPSIPPLLDGWDVAGWTEQADGVGGNFYDWFCMDDGRLAVAVGDSLNEGIEAALSAAALRTALRCHARYRPDGDRLLDQTNLTVWTNSAGDQFASVFFGLVDIEQGLVRYATAGETSVLLVRPDGWHSLNTVSPPLGASPEATYPRRECRLRPGEALLVFTEGVRDAPDDQGRPLGEAGLAVHLREQLGLSAAKLAELARDRLEAHSGGSKRQDRTVLVIKSVAP